MKKIKFVEQNWFELLIFIFSAVIAVTIVIVLLIVVKSIAGNWFSFLLALAGVAGGQFIIIIKNYREYKKGSNMAVSCDYQKRLYDLGILKIYPKRRETEDEGYYYELLEKLEKLNSSDVQNSEKIIKMIRVSLNKLFENPNEDEIIWDICKKMSFKVMICEKDNFELNSRLDFINVELKKYYDGKEDDWIGTTKDNAPIFNEIETSIRNIKSKIIGDRNINIELRPYKFSPYATMIIIDDHIYYTPNVLEYRSYVPKEKIPPELAIDAELSMCIHRKSEYGKRLEKLYDALWNYTPKL